VTAQKVVLYAAGVKGKCRLEKIGCRCRCADRLPGSTIFYHAFREKFLSLIVGLHNGIVAAATLIEPLIGTNATQSKYLIACPGDTAMT